MSTLKDLLDREKEEEAEATPPPSPETEIVSSPDKDLTEKRGEEEYFPVHPEKETTLKELLDLEKEEEAEDTLALLPETEIVSSSAKDLTGKRGEEENVPVPPEKDVTLKELLDREKEEDMVLATETGSSSSAKDLTEKRGEKVEVVSEDFFVSEEADTFDLPLADLKQSDISTGQTEFQVPTKSLQREGLKSNKSSSDDIVLEGPGVLEKLTEYEEAEGSKSIDDKPQYSDTDSYRTPEKSFSSPDTEYSKFRDAEGTLESTEKLSGFLATEGTGNDEAKSLEPSAASALEMNVILPEKDKGIVRLPSNEIATLKSFPSVGVNLDTLLDLNISPGVRSNVSGHLVSAESIKMMEEAWDRLKKSFVYFNKELVGTLAATDSGTEALNYDQVFVRDFVPSGLACLMKNPPEPEIVKNFLLKTLYLQGREKRIDDFTLGEGVMPASFKVQKCPYTNKKSTHDGAPVEIPDILIADFGGSAIGRVAPVDSGFWWIIMLKSYAKSTHDYALVEDPKVQKGMKLILNLCLSDGFDTFPTLLCADGCSMIDRRMGIYGYPIEIQTLFYFALRCAQQMLKPERDDKELLERIDKRIRALSYHIQKYYWLDFTQLNNIYRYKTEEYSHTAVNKFNVIPESIPDWVFDFMPLRGGYLIGNVSPARMDFRWFLVGNCIAILSSLVTSAQAEAIMDLVEERWEELIGEMPLKITYPALEGHEWRLVTGYDPKNTRWSYHNGGSWPVLLWLLVSACIKVGRPQMAKKAVELAEQRLSKDGWPEYYDGKNGRYIGKQARKYQTWSISGYLVAKLMIENPSNLSIIALEEDKKAAKSRLTRSSTF